MSSYKASINQKILRALKSLDQAVAGMDGFMDTKETPAILQMIGGGKQLSKNIIVNSEIQYLLENASREDIALLVKSSGYPEYLNVDRLWYKYRDQLIKQVKQEEFQYKNLVFLNLKHEFLAADAQYSKLDGLLGRSYAELKVDFFKQTNPITKLHSEQIKAITDCSHSTLLRARAGSGKTTVIKHKIDFMIRHAGLLPEDFMVLAFNKAAAKKIKNDMQQEMGHSTFENARTFHSLAYRIVKPNGKKILFDCDDGNNAKQTELVASLLSEKLDDELKQQIYQFFHAELESPKGLLAQKDYDALKINTNQSTLKGDTVKSQGEKWIADFLFEHGFSYSYERCWYQGKKGYYPPFSLMVGSDYHNVVIEYWEIDEKAPVRNAPEYGGKSWEQYRNEMQRKRQYWKNWNQQKPRRQIFFLEVSITDAAKGRISFEQILKKQFASISVQVKRRSNDQLLKEVVKNGSPKLAKMCTQFISRAKKAGKAPNDIQQSVAPKDKEKVFVRLACKIYQRYCQVLLERNLIDFDDLLELATKKVNEKQGEIELTEAHEPDVSLNQLIWLIIDEYQDFSVPFFNLVKEIRQHNPSLRLFCVGDSWQAINGFSGSNLKYFNSFEQYFPGANLLDLQNNYRSQANIVEQGNKFMVLEPGASSVAKAEQVRQPIQKYYINRVYVEQRKEFLHEKHPDYHFLSSETKNGQKRSIDSGCNMARIFKLCYQLMSQHSFIDTQFMILARSNYQAYGYETLAKFKQKLKKCFGHKLQYFNDFDAQVECTTAHRSKGKEADVVILLNVNKKHFPTVHPDNQLYSVLGVRCSLTFKEEERLFYVAITRAKQKLYLLTEEGQESEFLDRIDAYLYQFN
ncbi:ATP-dependent helicase [Pelagibaculum spongiae]|uniref:DNA 3'-5' helicase n=1 Tax=Pelagibaculum spongiae TaxID=2080658 RepID=A0A2V1GXE8_9GAMM|nr:ATP-dependent helicase [Pelagibaculum spongiae]PVZ64525.1 hypothetical protein DC094_19635 [Pelagibaculum spongiae]